MIQIDRKECTCKHHVGGRLLPIDDFYPGSYNRCKECSKRTAVRYRKRKISEDPSYKIRQSKSGAEYRMNGGKQHMMYYAAMGRARNKGLEFSIVQDDIVIPTTCPILGINLDTTMGVSRSDNSPSLDRIDNNKGYSKDNIIVMSWRANKLKNTATLDELILLGQFAERIRGRS